MRNEQLPATDWLELEFITDEKFREPNEAPAESASDLD